MISAACGAACCVRALCRQAGSTTLCWSFADLGLRALEGQPLLMFSKQIDDVWHTCLLFSRLYADLCQQAFGQFVHHEPADGPEPDLEARWQEFEAAYRRVYGEPHRLWRMGRAGEHTGDDA